MNGNVRALTDANLATQHDFYSFPGETLWLALVEYDLRHISSVINGFKA